MFNLRREQDQIAMSDNNILVSVAMAVYNGERYLAEQLQSLVDQTYRPLEIIITDDASADNSSAVIKEFSEKHPFIRLFRNDTNRGVTASFENSIRMCKGDFIAISDQDDIWEMNKIESFMKEQWKEDACFCNSLLVNKAGIPLNKTFKSVMTMRSYYSGAPFLLGNCIPGHNIMMKSSFAREILPFPKNIMYDRWISYCASANNGIKYIDITLVRYRQHESNTFGIKKSNKREKPSKAEKFRKKLEELRSLSAAPVKDENTKSITLELISLFKRNCSLRRSLFFFRNYSTILSVKKKSDFRKILFCLKMFFKPNY